MRRTKIDRLSRWLPLVIFFAACFAASFVSVEGLAAIMGAFLLLVVLLILVSTAGGWRSRFDWKSLALWQLPSRLTERAGRVLALAQAEARRLNHEHVGTEHILLGLVKEGSGVGATALRNLSIDLRRIRMEVEKSLRAGPKAVTTGKQPPTPAARLVLAYAAEEARSLKHNYVGTEHVLLGLLRQPEEAAGKVLGDLGLNSHDVAHEVCRSLGHNFDI
jgi:hypothetical protein